MKFKKWVNSIQTAGYNGARTVHKERLKIELKLNKKSPNRDKKVQKEYEKSMNEKKSHF